jgi:uncharacterized protein YbaR (Trm112 family)
MDYRGHQIEVVACPVCGQKLALQRYILVGSRVVCANPACNTTLRVASRKPAQIERVSFEETLNQDSSPESYG